MNKEQELWQQVKELLKASSDEATFNQIFEPINEIHKFQNNFIYLIVENALAKFRIDKFYLSRINELLLQCSNDKAIQFKIITRDEAAKDNQVLEMVQNPQLQNSFFKSRNLCPDYTFANFVTGEANREAFVFSTKVAESPSVTINPFYIFGDVGLGKTHLMTAIGHYMLDNNPNAKIVFTTAQQFVEDYFKAKNKNQKNPLISAEFDNYYQTADLLLVDDIQYLADKQGSQDEFFKIFEILFNNNKQIIVTSDRPANELNIIKRLKSRFSWGIQTDIKKPNLELRKRILKGKANFLIEDPSEIPDSVITFIAENFDQNVRELEGALRRFISYCVSFNVPYTVENAELALEAIITKDKVVQNETNTLHIEKIKEIIASYFNINVKELSSPSRKQEYVYARQLTIYILKTKYNLTLNKIGSVLGGRDHATIAHALEKITESIKTDAFIREDIENIIASLDRLYE